MICKLFPAVIIIFVINYYFITFSFINCLANTVACFAVKGVLGSKAGEHPERASRDSLVCSLLTSSARISGRQNSHSFSKRKDNWFLGFKGCKGGNVNFSCMAVPFGSAGNHSGRPYN
jgi:hypothetical protein